MDRVHAQDAGSEQAAEPPAARAPGPAATILNLQRTAGNQAVNRLLARKPPEPKGYPWIGRIKPWSAALRAAPSKYNKPKAKALADLPRGTEVTVINKQGGWLSVQAQVGGTQVEGYVSQELVEFVRQSAFELGEIVVTAHVPTVPEALVTLKRFERRQEEMQGKLTLTEDEQSEADLAISVLKRTGKYLVDGSTFTVTFDRSTTTKVQIKTIEDFILFVEEVERAYPGATRAEIATEIRQLWYSDENWDLLSAGQGVKKGSKLVDIETEAPIATNFDMKQLAPAKGSLQLDTAMGKVDIGHVMAGLEVRIVGGMAASYPESYMEKRDSDTYKNTAKYDAMKAASGGDTTDFATWSGDLGQAYAEYITERYFDGKTSATLASAMASWATKEEILGDIHGYVLQKVWQHVPESQSPTGGQKKISNYLRDMYLVPKTPRTYRSLFEEVTGKSGTDLKDYIRERTLAFARLWYSKNAYSKTGWWDSDGWGPTEILKNYRAQFDKHHAKNETSADPKDKLDAIVDQFLKELDAKTK